MPEKLPLEAQLEGFFLRTLPTIPFNVKEIFVQIMPWLALINGILGLASVIPAYQNSFARSYGMTSSVYLDVIGNIIESILMLLAFSPLRINRRKGWNYLYFSVLVAVIFNVLSALLNMPWGTGGLIFALIFAAVELWILFQIRERYY